MAFEELDCGNNLNVILTEPEAERIRNTIRGAIKRRSRLAGDARKTRNTKAAISQATSASLIDDMGSITPTETPRDMAPVLTVGRPYPPCFLACHDLQPMRLADLRTETHHRGRQLTVKRVSPVASSASKSWTIVQDQDGETERLEVVLHTTRYGRDALELSSFTIKEPYFTITEEGEQTLRIDHPSDLIVHVLPPQISAALPPADNESQVVSYKEKGNAALQANKLLLAHAHYTAGLALAVHLPNPTPCRDLSRNRSYVNLLLGHFDAAKSDALAALIPQPDHDPDQATNSHSPSPTTAADMELNAISYHHAATAAYNLAHFHEAHTYLQHQLALTPEHAINHNHNNKANNTTHDPKRTMILTNLTRTEARLNEQHHGIYSSAYASTTLNQQTIDAASFVSNTVVGNSSSPKKGRGLFAAREIAAGEVVLFEKAFCFYSSTSNVRPGAREESHSASDSVDGCDGDGTVLAYDVRDGRVRMSNVGLERAVVERVRGNPSLAGGVLGLCGGGGWEGDRDHDHDGGDERAGVVETRDGEVVVDVFRVRDIVARNGFGVGRGAGGRGGGDRGAGLWIRAAYINHSCVPNTQRQVIGDLIVVRAMRHIAAGEEILQSYDASADYDARQQALMNTWGFQCDCERRHELAKQADAFVDSVPASANIRLAVVKARRLAKAIHGTYDEERYRGLPRLATRGIEAWLARATTACI